MYGDAMNVPAALTPRQNAALSDLQLSMLVQWAKGDFEADYDPEHQPPKSIEQVPVREQGEVLTRAALEFCLADAFHPGCEITWPVRAATMYMAPFRILHAPPGWIAPNLGSYLNSDGVAIPDGPLYGQQAGGLTAGWRCRGRPTPPVARRLRQSYDPLLDPGRRGFERV